MVGMKRFFLATSAAVGLLAAVAPISASAKIIELGATTTPLVAPVCPPGGLACTIVLAQVTGLETVRDGVGDPTVVTKPGSIVAWTVGLSQLDTNRANAKRDIHTLDLRFGGTAQAGITVLKPTGPKSQRRWTVVAQSPITHLQPYFGQVVQFPLQTSLPVTPGEAIALTVPFWAPVLSIDLPPRKFAYRQSRTANCGPAASTEQAQLTLGASTRYGCDYPGNRIEYSATEITTPSQTKNYVKAADRLR